MRLPRPVRGIVRWLDEERASRVILESGRGSVLYMTLMLGLALGLRREEMTRLRMKDIGEDEVLIHGKGAKNRTLPLESLVADTIREYKARTRSEMVRGVNDPGTLLVYSLGKRAYRYKPDSIYEMVVRHGERLGIPLCCHDLRRTFGRALHSRDVDIQTISKLLGHESIDTTILYLGLDMVDMRRALRSLYTTYGTNWR